VTRVQGHEVIIQIAITPPWYKVSDRTGDTLEKFKVKGQGHSVK